MLTIHKASAGSGKTFTLAREYIKLILGLKNNETGEYRLRRGDNDGFRSVLAITFTNKATEEMKNRIIKELALLSDTRSESAHREELMKILHCGAGDLAEASGRALRNMLFNYNGFHVSTIDAFFQLILKAFAHEADLNGNYNLELDNNYVVACSVAAMYEKLNNEHPDSDIISLEAWLKSYMRQLIASGHSFNILNRDISVYNNFIKFICDASGESFVMNYERIMAYLEDRSLLTEFGNRLNDELKNNGLEDAAVEACQTALKAIGDIEYDYAMRGNGKTKTAVNANLTSLFRKWTEKANERRSSPSATCLNVYENIDKAYTSGGQEFRTTGSDATIHAATDALIRCYTVNHPIRKALDNIYTLGLLSHVMPSVEEYRQQHEAILLSDTNSILHGIIGNCETPFVYEKIGEMFNHFLIDEFQDTSHMQWINLRPLIDESLSKGNDNLLIGDVKQSIYRFRGSDPSILGKVAEGFRSLGADECIVRGAVPGENTNWRSSADVVKFNNMFFKQMAKTMGFADHEYAGVEQLIPEKHKAKRGYVKFSLVSTGSKNTEAELKTQVLDSLADEVSRQLRIGYRPADIAVIVRSAAEGVSVINRLLNDKRFPDLRIVSDQSLLVSQNRSVRLIISVLRYISTNAISNISARYGTGKGEDAAPDRSSRRALALLLNRFEYFLKKYRENSDNITDISSSALTQALYSDEEITDMAIRVTDMDCLNLPSIVENIIGTYLPESALQADNIFISALQDMVLDYCDTGNSDLTGFLRWWDESGVKQSVAGGVDPGAINVITVHKSKGLEYKCVHVPFASYKLKINKDLQWFDTSRMFPGFDPAIVPPMMVMKCTEDLRDTALKDQYDAYFRDALLDEFNVLYVALTRAVDELIVTAAAKLPDGKARTSDDKISSLGNFICSSLNKCSGLETTDGRTFTLGIRREDSATAGTEKETSRGKPDEHPRRDIKPSENLAMPPYRTFRRTDLWSGTRVDLRKDFGEARDHGTIMHGIMSKIRTAADVDTAVRRAVRAGLIPAAKEKATADEIRGYVTSEPARRWFEGFTRLLAERPILIPADSRHPNGTSLRPDRVVWTADGRIEIIDYKFGEEDNRYLSDMKTYKRLICANFPDTPVSGFIWYAPLGKIVEV